MDYTVVVTDHTPTVFDIERSVFDGINVELIDGESPEVDLDTAIIEADALISSHFHASAEVIGRMPKCKVISRTGIGVDYIDIEAATDAGILVTNVPDYCIDEVSNHAMAFILALQRFLLPHHSQVVDGEWGKDRFPIRRLREQTLGLIAFGAIARALTKKVQPLGLSVLAYDPYCADAEIEAAGAEPIDLESLVARSDIISLHAPLTDETEAIIDGELLDSAKPGAFIINTARGGLLELDALTDRLVSGDLAGAGLDVFDKEPLPDDHPIRAQSNTILTPHMAFYSIESIEELRRRAAENVRTVLTGDEPEHIVNRSALEAR